MARVRVASGADRETMRSLRMAAGSLNELAITSKTRQRYAQAARAFFLWASEANVNWERSIHALSDAVAAYLEYLWSAGLPKGQAGNLLAALQHEVPRLRGELREGWRLYSVWNRVELATQAEPLPLEVWEACVGKLLSEGKLHGAAAFAVAFQGMLRPMEVLNLTVGDLATDARRLSAVVKLRATK
eukprot:3845064-Amphidinium_carterae.2